MKYALVISKRYENDVSVWTFDALEAAQEKMVYFYNQVAGDYGSELLNIDDLDDNYHAENNESIYDITTVNES